MKNLADMNLMDDFLFLTMISSEEYGPGFARYLLQVILQRPIKKVKVHAQYVLPGGDSNLHGIRLDAYVSEEHMSIDGTGELVGELYDIEPEKKKGHKSELPWRVRYYHALIDARSLKTRKNYTSLQPTYVIMITDFDPFDKNRVIYTIKNRCLEVPDLPYEDGLYTMFLYTDGAASGLPEDLISLLRFMKTTTKENAVNTDLENIWNMVEDMKQREEVRKGYMKFQELLQEERAEERRKTEEERRKAEKLIAEANERAEQSEERANQANIRADQANIRADQANIRADQATDRAEQAERKILALERELEKYKK